MAFFPESLGNLQGVDVEVIPPSDFVARIVQLSMMDATKGYGELVADLQA